MKLFGILLLCVLPLACDNFKSADVPQPYSAELATIRDRNLELQRKVTELQRQINLLSVEQQFNSQQANSIAIEVLNKLGYKQGEYRVNVDLLKIEKTSR